MSSIGNLVKVIDEGNVLEELYVDSGPLYFIAKDIARGGYFQKTVLRYFYDFIRTIEKVDPELTIPRFEDFKLVVSLTIMKGQILEDTISDMLRFKEIQESELKDAFEILFQNAFIYAIGCSYSAQIRKNYMHPPVRNNEPSMTTSLLLGGMENGEYIYPIGKYRAAYTDEEYAAYVLSSHRLLATVVVQNNLVQRKRILAAIGYLINPELA